MALSWSAAVDAAGPPPAIEVRVETVPPMASDGSFPTSCSSSGASTISSRSTIRAHYFSSEGLGARVYTVKVEVADPGGEMLAEVHGAVHAIELAPGATVTWYFYPMMPGKDLSSTRSKDLRLYKEEDIEAHMTGAIEIFGPPPFTGN
jgi:hypothetical protein